MDEYLWPARNVAEYAYCPRLFYLMEVEGVQIANSDVLEGRHVHRRVDSPSKAGAEVRKKSSQKKKNAAEKSGDDTTVVFTLEKDTPESDEDSVMEQRQLTARSLTLTSESLRLTATLDLAEIEGDTAIPVEYRKGSPRKIDLEQQADDGWNLTTDLPKAMYEPWPTDRVQLMLQAILLEDAGYAVPKMVIYYATTKQKLDVEITDTLRAEALEVFKQAQTASQGERPLPLVNDGRCVRCSLQPFCLPDEVNYLLTTEKMEREKAKKTLIPPRPLLPLREDGLFLVAQKDGSKIGVRGESLRFTDYEGKVIREIPLANIEEIALLGSVQITTQAVHTLSAQGVPIIYLSAVGRPIAFIDPLDASSAITRRSQILALEDEERKVQLVRAIVAAKIENQRTLLMRNHPDLPKTIPTLLNDAIKSVADELSVDAIRGHEGYAAKLYFENFGGMFKSEEGELFQTNGRMRRPPPDPINATISFAYSMLVHECTAALRLARLDPSIGALHVARPGRPALSLDLMEPFRILIADSIAVSAFNRRELGGGHFQQTAAGCNMTDYGRKAFFSAYSRRMDTEIRHPVFGYKLNYRRMLSLHAKMLAVWFRGEMETLSFLTTR